MRLKLTFLSLFALGALTASGVDRDAPEDKFRQLEELFPTANIYRAASGAPGHAYWQQRADYLIDVELDDETQEIRGREEVTYHNNSPDRLEYLWVQLDPNLFSPESHAVRAGTALDLEGEPSYSRVQSLIDRRDFDGSCEVSNVRDASGAPLAHTLVGTMMRLDLPKALESGASTSFSLDWRYSINDAKAIGGRTGYEHFEEDGNYLYEIAQWFPRMAAYTDVTGWQNKQFLGRGEFTLEFGDYQVAITVPDDHVVASTGVLLNPEEVLSERQRQRLDRARSADRPVFIVTPEEAVANQRTPAEGKQTWVFGAENVRDFAFASSRKFIWDAIEHEVDGKPVMAMSYWPIEGEPLWSQYSTQAIVHTLDVYSRFTFPYPYPVAISVNGPIGGMEYPMICFNGPRPEDDGTYSKETKYDLISVIIHEVGHNWFPMIVNSDERQWTWMDEGLNSFVQYLAEKEWEEDYPSWWGEPQEIASYMASERQVPIMTNSESILQFGNNAYAKPATALNVLRESVMGRELFDFAFKRYANRWAFRRPMPADFFRTMEDASAVDLDWFWRGWFYSTDHTDLAITNVRRFNVDTRNPDIEKPLARADRDAEAVTLSQARNAALQKRIDLYPELRDFYNQYDELDVTPEDREAFASLIEDLEEDEAALLETALNFYVVDIENVGGLVGPVPLEVHYADGGSELLAIPAEIWRSNPSAVSRLILTEREVVAVLLDPHLETADTDLTNNRFPPAIAEERFRLKAPEDEENPMQEAAAREAK